MIDPLVRPEDLKKDPRFKEKELSGLLGLEPRDGRQAIRITAIFAEEDHARMLDTVQMVEQGSLPPSAVLELLE